jgi:hypothetical protein
MKNILIGLALGLAITLFLTRDKDVQINDYDPIDSFGIWHFDGGFRNFEEYTDGDLVEIFTKRDYALEISKSEKMERIEISMFDDEGYYDPDNLCSKASEKLSHVNLLRKYVFESNEFIEYKDVDHLRTNSPSSENEVYKNEVKWGSEYYYIYKSLLDLGHFYDTLYYHRSIKGEKNRCFIYLKKDNLDFNHQ